MILHYLFLLGICVEAMTGAIAAGRKQMDLVGVFMIAWVTALGGGSIRDILFNTYPLTWVSSPHYLLYIAGCALVAVTIPYSIIRMVKVFLILDALGLSAFVVIGTDKLLSMGMSAKVAILSGMLTGISGGMLRDILCNDIPLVFRKEVYALIAFFGSLLFIGLKALALPDQACVLITLFSVFMSRLLVILFKIELPKFDFSKPFQSS